MLARHGWKSNPSPRRGFTMVEASPGVSESPVVVVLHDSSKALRLFRAALDEAVSRTLDLVVLDYGATPLRDELNADSAEVDERDRTAMRALWANPHVRVMRADPVASDLEETVSFCEKAHASMLILSADHIGSASVDDELSARIFNGGFDVLIVTDHRVVHHNEGLTGRDEG